MQRLVLSLLDNIKICSISEERSLVLKPKISIIVPVYNVEKYLNRCVDSIINQTYENLEIILVNDGSTDKSSEICDMYSKRDNRIKVIHKKNGGLSSARNAGLDIASGLYIGFVDSDDWISNDMYEHLYSIIEEYECDIAKCDALYTRATSINNKTTEKQKIEVIKDDEAIKKLLETSTMLSVCKRLYKASLFIGVRFPHGKINEDFVPSYNLFKKSNFIVISNLKKYYYYMREGSITKSGLSEKDFDYIDACDEIIKLVSNDYPQFLELAKQRRYRANFTLLAKLAYFGSAPNNTNIEEQQKTLLKEIRKNYFNLVASPILSLSRKLMISVMCINYDFFRFAIKIGKKMTKKYG